MVLAIFLPKLFTEGNEYMSVLKWHTVYIHNANL